MTATPAFGSHRARFHSLVSRAPLPVLVFLWTMVDAALLWGQPPVDLEPQLEQAQGTERISLITRYLADASYDDPQRAVVLGQEALEFLADAPDERQELAITCGLCRAHMKDGDLDATRSLGERCAEQAEYEDETVWLAWAHLWCLGKSYARDHQLGLAIVHEMRAVELYEAVGDPEPLAVALTQTGMDLADLGDLTTALEYQLRARTLFQSAGALNGEAQALLRIGSAHASLQDPDRAFDYARQAHEAFRAAGSANGEAAALLNMGIGHAEQGRLEQALELFGQSLEIKKRLGEPGSIALGMLNIGAAHSNLRQLDEAIVYIQRAIDQFRELGAKREMALAGVELARAFQRGGELDRALDTLRNAIALAAEIDLGEGAFEAYHLLAELEEQSGDLPAALTAMRRYDEIKSRFLNTTNAQRITEMEVRYQAESQAREIEELKERQVLQTLEMQSQRTARTGLVVGFSLLLIVLALLFNRYRLRAQAARMAEAVENERAVNASLREVDRLKDDFLANTSHELRTPLYGMVGLTESLLDGTTGELPAAARKNLELILSSGNRLSTLVGDILDSAKLSRRGLELTKNPVDIHTLSDVVITLSKPLVEDRPIELINAVSPNLPPALADSDRIQQVLHNLVGNAIKFTERGEVTVEADLEDEGLVVRVRDTGIGIAPELQDKIFNSFQQADASIERTYGGTGLGLTISRQLARLHGGDLWAESAPGQGATFCFTLPLATDQTIESETSPRPMVSVQQPSREGLDLTLAGTIANSNEGSVVLAIDDEPVNRQVLANHLAPHGYRVLSASSGAEALDLMANETVDLVLLDIMMPRMSGYEVCRRIRENNSREQLPVIFLSAKNQASDRIASFEEGGNDYLAKPIAKQELLKRVETQLELLQTHRNQAGELKVLQGLLNICAHCKRIRDQNDRWDAIESYIDQHSEASFSHGLCPDCAGDLYPELDLT